MATAELREIDRSLVRGVAWNGALKLVAQAVTWSTTLIVSRLLDASDYGIFALASLLLGGVQILTEFGLGTAVVTRPGLTARDFAELNTVALVLGLMGAALMCAGAPAAAWLFRRPEIAHVVLVLSVTPLLAALRTVPWARMQRELRFRRLAVYEALQSIGVAVMCVLLARHGYGYWTLVAAAVGGAAATTAVTIARHPTPFARPDLRRLRSALEFSRDVLVTRAAWYVYNNADFLVAGRLLGAAAAGYYGLAWTLAHLVVDRFAQLVFQVTPGILSRVQHDIAALRRYFVMLVGTMSLALWPLTIGLSIAAADFVPAVLGARWQPIVFPLRVLSAYSSTWVVLGLAGQALVVLGEQRFARDNNLQQVVGMSVAFVIGAHWWGADGIALAWVVVHPVFAALRVRLVLRRIELEVGTLFRSAMLPAASGCAVMVVTTLAVRHAFFLDLVPLWRLVGVVAIGAISYLGLQFVVFRPQLRHTLELVRALRRPDAAASV